MKKILSSVLLMSATMMAFSQTITTQNFESFTLGNLATDTAGNTAGQNGYYIYNGTASDYQIATIDAGHGKSLKVSAGTSASTATRYAFLPISTTATTGNNFLRAQFTFNTGTATGAGQMQFTLFDTTGGIVGVAYDVTTKKMLALTAINQGTTRKYLSAGNLGTNTYPANTWVTVSCVYNKSTGATYWGTPEGTYNLTTAPTGYSLITGLTPAEFDIIMVTGATDTTANTMGFDDITIAFLGALSTSETKSIEFSDLTISPNPTSDYLNIKSESKINKIEVFDAVGRKVDVGLEGDKVDVRYLQSGNYIINVETKEGKTSKKFIKK